MIMSNKVYDILKEIALVWLPAISVFYAGLSAVWGLPFEQQIPTTIMLVDTLLGAVLHISTKEYNANGSADN